MPGRDRTCDLGIKSPAGATAASGSQLKMAAAKRFRHCTKLQRIASCGDEPVLQSVLQPLLDEATTPVSRRPSAREERHRQRVLRCVRRKHESALNEARYARLVRMTLLRIRTPDARHGGISEATRNGGPEFQGVARNQPTRGTVPRATADACHFDRDAATKNAAAPRSTNDPSPIETPRS
jgi:hypothetical protein